MDITISVLSKGFMLSYWDRYDITREAVLNEASLISRLKELIATEQGEEDDS